MQQLSQSEIVSRVIKYATALFNISDIVDLIPEEGDVNGEFKEE